MTEWLRFKRLDENTLPLPQYETPQSAGVDFAVCLTRTCKEILSNGTKRKFLVIDRPLGSCRHHFGEEKVPDINPAPNGADRLVLTIRPHETIMVPLGWIVEFGAQFVLHIHVRSSVGLKGLNLANGTGIVDPDYRGELFACLWNRTDQNIEIPHGKRFVQGVLIKFNQAIITEVDELSETIRGQGGFGSTGDELKVGQESEADLPPESSS